MAEPSRSFWRDRSLWLDREYTPEPPLAADLECDVAIVGGGYTGLSAAYFLKREQPGLEIALLEREVIGFGASGRNGGFAMTLLGENVEDLIGWVGEERARHAHGYMRAAVDHVVETVREHGIDCALEKNGYLALATSPRHAEKVEGYVRGLRTLGTDAAYWDRDRTRSEIRSDAFYAACHDPHCAILDPARFAWGMKRVVRELGVSIYEGTGARLVEEGPTLRLRTTKDTTVRARTLVLATNAWSRWRRTIPVFTYMVATEPLGDTQWKEIGWRGRQGLETSNRLIHYFRPTVDGRIALGGGDAFYWGDGLSGHDRSARAEMLLKQTLVEWFPCLEGVRFTHHWGGPVLMTVDWFPSMGRTGRHRNILYALAYNGHGVASASYSGAVLRDLLLERDSEWTRLFFVNRKGWPIPRSRALRRAFFDLYVSWMRRSDRRAMRSAPPTSR